MLISLQADYAIRMLMFIARGHAEGKTYVTRDIAEHQHIPRVFLTKIVAYLSSEGLLETHRGKGGGIALARKPSAINILEVVEAFEGSLAFNECTGDTSVCVLSDDCGVRHFWSEAEDHLRNFFRNRTLADLIELEDKVKLTQLDSVFLGKGGREEEPKSSPRAARN
jgi:Rrf2 family nitric oxide-sensitive transcriptional repressor